MTGAQSPGNTPSEGHLGDQLRAGRESVGWSRTDISKMTGLSVGIVARIELKGRGTEGELDAYRDALKVALGDVVAGDDRERLTERPEPPKARKAEKSITASPPVTGLFASGAVRVTEWNGFTRGDHVKLAGEEGTFKFLFYHEDDRQAYVELSGPLVRYHDRTVGTQLRSVRPERVLPASARSKRGKR